jgi:hypothetical protein
MYDITHTAIPLHGYYSSHAFCSSILSEDNVCSQSSDVHDSVVKFASVPSVEEHIASQ